jgi:hypothetical protein
MQANDCHGLREWAENKDYNAPIPFKEMQKKGREREDGTIIVRTFQFLTHSLISCQFILLNEA